MNKIVSMVVLVIGITFLLSVTSAMAQQQFVYPQKGQSAEQQKKDEYDCHSWAVKQTGFDPTAAAQAPCAAACTAAGRRTAGLRRPGSGTGRGRGSGDRFA